MDLTRAQGFLIDLDGTLLQGQNPLPGAIEFVRWIVKAEIPYLYWTNNSTRTPKVVAAMLQEMGFPAHEQQVFTSSIATSLWLREHVKENPLLYVVGEAGLREIVSDAGATLIDSTTVAVDAVVVGLDRHVTFSKLSHAMTHLLNGAMFVGTNPDHALPTEAGFIPGAGALLAFLERATKRSPHVIGKPNPEFVRAACEKLSLVPRDVIVIGDNPETDLRAATLAGARTIWVKTGVRAEQAVKADLEIASLRDLLN
ncbi:HAD-IIA family hydrolase [Sulfoacidibacillus thermotolerans]|uniref:Acid sugar phosphatase n=1 Tax=Sulfoacidibacillus thermotolerans TaxID=1765684 RepID=A0A2U3DCA3_SULT2|nr:HAD-IIA family hydrolase [Sulfoacidibacillus thermotolerans]PWI58914.1 hypothetical protein BM613_02190 [Sulfoacidibacillus thermotolerans]